MLEQTSIGPSDHLAPWNVLSEYVTISNIMATTTKRSGQDRKRVSKQKHEIGYTGTKVARKAGTSPAAGKAAVKKAKKQTRSVSRGKVESRAEKLVS